MKKNFINDVYEIIKKVKTKIPNFDENRFIKAYKFALKAHGSQKRKDDTLYIGHLIEAVKILADLRVDENTLIAAMLHDISEDTNVSINDVQRKFGEHVAFLVNGVTKLSKVYYKNEMEKRQVESLKKLLLHMSKDPRVIFIKLADRLHNMKTIEFVKPQKQARIAKETLEVYVPIANLMGIQGIKHELEDLCFKNLYPQEYKKFVNKILKSENNISKMTGDVVKTASDALRKDKIKAIVTQRPKSVFTIFKKIKFLRKTVDDIYDLMTLRVIVENTDDCYKALGVIHSLFKPDLSRFKDYIAVPKINGYQSIHTTVLGSHGVPIEFQIRTRAMHEDSELGLNFMKLKAMPSRFLNWMEQILELEKDEPSIEYFMKDFKEEISDRITVFDINGNPVYLPFGSSVLDFIYTTDPQKINYAHEARINNKAVPLTAPLRKNDKVKIITSRVKHEPKLEWISFLKTNLARAKLKELFRTKSKHEKIAMGKELLQKACNIAGLGFVEDIDFKKLKDILYVKKDFVCNSIYDLYSAVGEGQISTFDAIKFIYMSVYSSKEKNGRRFEEAIPLTKKKIRLEITAGDRPGLVNDATDVLRQYNINILNIQAGTRRFFRNKAYIIVDFEMRDLGLFTDIIKKLEQIGGVEKVERKFAGQFVLFIAAAIAMLAALILHPFFIGIIISEDLGGLPIIMDASIYGGFLIILMLSVFLKKITEKNFPGARRASILWATVFLILLLSLAVLGFEVYYYKIDVNPVLVTILSVLILAYIGVAYLEYAKIKLPRK